MIKIKNGIYFINDWYICKIGCYWYLLSDTEYMQNKENLEKFIDSVMICKFISKKELIKRYKREYFYQHIFKDVNI